jgi:DNA-binding PadR family transcriptional regulator
VIDELELEPERPEPALQSSAALTFYWVLPSVLYLCVTQYAASEKPEGDIMSLAHLDKMRQELRRGVLVLAVLSSLETPHYGYSLRQQLKDAGIDMDEGTLYPLVRRLADQGLLDSEWRQGEGRERRYYWLSPTGAELLIALTREWRQLNQALEPLMSPPLES